MLVMLPSADSDLTTDLAPGKFGRVNVRISYSSADGPYQLIEFSRIQPLCPGCRRSRDGRADIARRDRPRDSGRGGRARLRSSRAVAEVRAEKDGDAAIHSTLAQVDMGLGHAALQTGIAQRVGDLRPVVVNPRLK